MNGNHIMRTNQQSHLGGIIALAVLAFGGAGALAQSIPGVPEPGLILYGQVRNVPTGNSLLTYGTLRWTITPAGGAPVTVLVTLTNINDQFSYIARVPFESTLGGAFTLSPGALALSGAPINYARSATLSATPAGTQQSATIVSPALATFTFGAADRGRLERVDLLVSLPFFDTDGDGLHDNWERTYFGDLRYGVDDDPDRDGMSNRDEQEAGTSPNDPQSRFAFIDVAADPQGGIAVRWSSVARHTYPVQRSGDLTEGFTDLVTGVPATPGMNSYRDATATGPGSSRCERLCHRGLVDPPLSLNRAATQ